MRRRWIVAAACFGSWGAWAGNNVLPSDAGVLFDRPLAREEVEAKAGPHPSGALTCTRYADFMLREMGADEASPGPAYLVPAGEQPTACVAPRGGHSVTLDTAGFSFIGRRGPFLFFIVADGQGAEDFFLLRAPDGRRLYADKYQSVGTESLKAASFKDGVLRMSYTRGYDASCSLLKNGAACWSTMMKEGHFVRAIAVQPPPVAACAASYKARTAPISDASTITYDVDIALTPDGKSTVLHRGAIGCEPGP